jgi:hypothetical protein
MPEEKGSRTREVAASRKEEVSSGSIDDKYAKLFENIDDLVDQTLQIYELHSKEGEVVKLIDSSIVMLLNTLNTTISLAPETFHDDHPRIKSAILNNAGEIIIMQSNGNIVTKRFADLSAAHVMDIIKEIVPKMSAGAEAAKIAATEDVAVLKKVAKQFQRVRVNASGEQLGEKEEE